MLTPKKALVSLVMCVFGAMACASCAHKAPPTVAPPPVPVATASAAPAPTPAPAAPSAEPDAEQAPAPGPITPVVVNADNVSFTIPGGGVWHELQVPEGILAAYRNVSTKSLLLVTKDEFSGTTQAASLIVLRGNKEAGATLDSVKQVTLNGVKWVAISSHKGSVALTSWVTAGGGAAYNFTCGGPADNKEVAATCKTIAATLKVTQ